MLIQLANIIAGAVLALPGLKNYGNREAIEKLEAQMESSRTTIGWIELAIGVIALLARLGVLPLYIPNLGASFPQAIPAILIGLLLVSDSFKSQASFHEQLMKLQPYEFWIGLLGIAVGIGSLLFGCFITVFCRVPF